MDNNIALENNQPQQSPGYLQNPVLHLLIHRSSCRSFQDREIPDEILDSVLMAGVNAASGGNLQPFSIIKIRDEKTRHRLGELAGQACVEKAPVDLIFCIDFHRLKRWAELEAAPFAANNSFRHFWISFQDTIIAAQSICTAADSVGLGSVYIGTVVDFFRELQEMLNLPPQVFPVVMLCVGYPTRRPAAKRKLDPKLLIHEEKYREPSDEELLDAFHRKYPPEESVAITRNKPETVSPPQGLSGSSEIPVAITESKIEIFRNVCKTVVDEKFAEACVAEIMKKGFINRVQRYFGLHYVADEMSKGNEDYLKVMEEFGFGWFKKVPWDK